jgi:GH15 family glucan-1,4-alpha-glucosidase
MSRKEKDAQRLNDKLSEHMRIILKCTVPSKKYGRLLLASPPETRYPYVYPRDTSCAVQVFRRLVGSPAGYDAAGDAFELMRSMAYFIKDVQDEDGGWGQRYNMDGEARHIYKQEDNIAHGVSIVCNYLLAAFRLKKDVPDLDEFLESVRRALRHSIADLYHKELNLFHSTTSIHESAMESGYTCWVNFAFLYAFSLAHEVAVVWDEKKTISPTYLNFRKQFLHSVSELFMTGDRYVRRINPQGTMDLRPDFTLLSPYYFGFLHYKTEMKKSVSFIEKQLTDPEFGMIMRYLPFYDDFSIHVHAGNGPWLQYTAILAQYHYWNGNKKRGDELLETIDRYRNDEGEIPEHLSTCKRFEWFIEKEWDPGEDFAKEFHKPILLDGVDFDCILEEANNMARSYKETGANCLIPDKSSPEGGYIQFALPLMWSHAEYARALLVREKDWWKAGRAE